MKTGKNMSKRIVKLLIAVSVCLMLTGCVNTGAHIVPSVTIPPESTQPPKPTPSPTPEPVQVEEMADLSSAYDKNGLLIVGEEHFQQYISFKNIQVYEQCGDTFMDAVAVNEYPDTLVCALNIRFFDEDGTEIASGRVQSLSCARRKVSSMTSRLAARRAFLSSSSAMRIMRPSISAASALIFSSIAASC